MICPFCKKDVITIGVHDAEDNYQGELCCDYEKYPWSGLSYAVHHDGFGECLLCTDGNSEIMGGMLFDSAIEAIESIGRTV